MGMTAPASNIVGRVLAGLCVLLALGCRQGLCSQPPAQPRPNIVFILADDLGATDLSVAGSDGYRTPNLDRFASQSLRFTQAYANGANCAPSRAALMSGLYAPRTGVYTVNRSARGRARERMLIPTANKATLDPAFVTLAEVLRSAGYTTAHMGKWHLGDGAAGPRGQGFDRNIGGSRAGHPESYVSPFGNVDIPGTPEGAYLTDRLTQAAADFIAEHRDAGRPFFLYLPLYTVHTPIQPQRAFFAKTAGRATGAYHTNLQYAAMVEGMDHYVGRVLDALDHHGLAGNTLVVFTSDNGGHGSFTDHHPLRGSKGMFYEGGIRVPLLVRWPGVTTAGAVSREPVVLLDFYPTLAQAAGAVLPGAQPVDGVSLLPLLKDAQQTLDREAIYFHFPCYLQGYPGGEGAEAHRPPWRATPCSVIRTRRYKLIEYFETGQIELFNLDDDPGERHDLSAKQPQTAAGLLARLRGWRRSVDAPVPTRKNPAYGGH